MRINVCKFEVVSDIGFCFVSVCCGFLGAGGLATRFGELGGVDRG